MMKKEIKQEFLNDFHNDTLLLTEECAMPITAKSHEVWNLQSYKDAFYVRFVSESEDKLEIEFDMVGLGASVANALRRVLIAEVPSMAIEKVFLYQNTSVIPDEVLCHRLGLLPIFANPLHFSFPPAVEGGNDDGETIEINEEPAGDANENLIFELHIKCKKKKNISESTSLAQNSSEKLFDNAIVRAGQFKWIPIGRQVKIYSEDPPRIVNDGIVIAKLRPGQEIETRCHCVKGIGRDHAKFSPVSTASYRMLPEIRITKPIKKDDVLKFQSCFTKGVIEINEKGAAYVKNARRDMCSRNVLQHNEFKDSVCLTKNIDYFIFNVESIGALPAKKLVVTAARVLRAKLKCLHNLIAEKLALPLTE